ncbi:hypothetical protein M153_179200001, partial [Pseudoloma neurophilia]
ERQNSNERQNVKPENLSSNTTIALKDNSNGHNVSKNANNSSNEKNKTFSSKLSEDLRRRSLNKSVLVHKPEHSFRKVELINQKDTHTNGSLTLQDLSINTNKIKAHVEFGKLNFFIISDPSFQALCNSISLRLCQHFDSTKSQTVYNLNLLKYFNLFIKYNNKLFKMEIENDFYACLYENSNQLEIIITDIEDPDDVPF